MKNNYYLFLDGLRTIGFLIVFIAHLGQKYKTFFIAGKVGVALFFIISAFLFSTHLIQNIDAMKNIKHWIVYITKRIIKLYPAYIIVLIIELFLGNYNFPKFLSHIFLLDVKQHYWTIPVMIQFYLIIPFIIKTLKKMFKDRINVIIFFLLLTLGIYGFLYTQITSPFIINNASQTNIIFYGPSFLIGVILSYIYFLIQDKKVKILNILHFLGIFIPIFFLIIFVPYSYKMFTQGSNGTLLFFPLSLFSIFWSIIMLSLLFNKGKVKTFLENYFISYIGKISYNAYLIHIIVINIVFAYFSNFVIGGIISFCITLITSALLYELLEKPIYIYSQSLTKIEK